MQNEITAPTSDSIAEIKESYQESIQARDAAVDAAHRCGTLLSQIALNQGEMFGAWLTENLPEIPKVHALNFIKLASKSLSEISSKQGLLKLADEAEVAEKSDCEIKIESHIQFISQIRFWFDKRTKLTPISKWNADSKAKLKSELKPLVEIYESL